MPNPSLNISYISLTVYPEVSTELVEETNSSNTTWKTWLTRGLIVTAIGVGLYYGGTALFAGLSTLAASIGLRFRGSGPSSTKLSPFESSLSMELEAPYVAGFKPDPVLNEYYEAQERQQELMKLFQDYMHHTKTKEWQKALKELDVTNDEDDEEHKVQYDDFQRSQSSIVSSPVIELSKLDKRYGFKIDGEFARGYFDEIESDESGTSVGPLGDINGDGFPDFFIGAPKSNPLGILWAGEFRIFHGHKPPWSDINLSNSSTVLYGTQGWVHIGSSGSGGDVNGDGVQDIVSCTPDFDFPLTFYNDDAIRKIEYGICYGIFGHKDPWPVSIELSELINGFVVKGEGRENLFGFSVIIGNLNGDDFEDIVVGAPGATPLENYDMYYKAGKVYVMFGHKDPWPANIELSNLNGTNGFMINGKRSNGGFGKSVCMGDVNNDGIKDLIGVADSEIYVIFGHKDPWPASIELSSLDGTNGFVVNGVPIRHPVSVGDVDGDGIDDIIAIIREAYSIEYFYPPSKVCIIFGRNFWPAILKLPSNSVSTLVYQYWVSSVTVMNFDGGINDIVIGTNVNVAVIFGRKDWPAIMNLSNLDSNDGLIIKGEIEIKGYQVNTPGDLNGDGLPDLIIGSPGFKVRNDGFNALNNTHGRTYAIYAINSQTSFYPKTFKKIGLERYILGTITAIGLSSVACCFWYSKRRRRTLNTTMEPDERRCLQIC